MSVPNHKSSIQVLSRHFTLNHKGQCHDCSGNVREHSKAFRIHPLGTINVQICTSLSCIVDGEIFHWISENLYLLVAQNGMVEGDQYFKDSSSEDHGYQVHSVHPVVIVT